MSPVSGGMSGVRETGSRLVAVLGVLVILLVGGQCDRQVGVDANPGPVSLADLVAWWRLDREGVPPDLDQDDVERLAAILDEGRASWDAWMETRWRPFIESIPTDDDEEADAEPDAKKAARRRAVAADRLRTEAISLDDRTVRRIEEEGGLPPEAAARFGRWYRLERARRLAAGFATGGASPASPEAIVASASLDDRPRRAVVDVLDRTTVERQAGIDCYAAARRRTAALSDRAASWTADDGDERFGEEDRAIRTAFRDARRAVSLGAALALVDAATVVGDETVARRWRAMAARLLLADLESTNRHGGLAAATRRLVQLEGGDAAAIDRASQVYLDGAFAIEDSLSRMLVTGTTEEIHAATIEFDAAAVRLRQARDAAWRSASRDGGFAAAMLDATSKGPRRVAEWRSLWADRLTDEESSAVIAALGPAWIVPETLGDVDATWSVSLDVPALDEENRRTAASVIGRVFEGPPSARRPVPMTSEARTHPAVAMLLANHAADVRTLMRQELSGLVTRIATLGSSPEDEQREAALETVRRARGDLDRMARGLDDLDGTLATTLLATGIPGVDAAELDDWLARRARSRWWLDPEIRRAIAPGGEMEVGAWARFEVAVESAALPEESRDLALGIERELADRLGLARRATQQAVLRDVEAWLRASLDDDAIEGGPVWTTVTAQAAEERAIDAEIRRLIRERLPELDAAVLIDAWSAERVPAAAAWFAIGAEGFAARRRLSASAVGGEAVAMAFDEWLSARGALRDDMLTWWSETASPPTTGDDGHRRDAMRRETRVQIALARRRAMDGRLAVDLVRLLGPDALDDPFVRRLVASPIPVSQRLDRSPDESRAPAAAVSRFEVMDVASEASGVDAPGPR
ncbi:MAG: hypothetical protein RLZZ461_205 [Planctomycetota bacterium]